MTTIQTQFNKICSYQSNDFKDWFGDMKYEEETPRKLFSKKLERNMNDKEIMDELKPTEVSLSDVFNYLKTSAGKNDWMIFYCKDSTGVLRAVGVDWDGDGWDVCAHEVTDPSRWRGGCQVFSRNSFETLDETLGISDTLSLSDDIQTHIDAVKKAGYVVYKVI